MALSTFGNLLLPERKLPDGAYAVALANTGRVEREDRPPIEHLGSLLSWSGHVGVTPPLRAVGDPDGALRAAVELRDAAVRVVDAGLAGRTVDVVDLADVASHVDRALACIRFQAEVKPYFNLAEDVGIERVLHLSALSLVNLVTSGDVERLRACDGKCGFVFVNRGRGVGRRWCAMRGCGNKAKTRRRVRQRSAEGPSVWIPGRRGGDI